jgi:hypothetical protein
MLLKIFILGHETNVLSNINNHESFIKVNLNTLPLSFDNTQELAENRFFLSDFHTSYNSEYLGLISQNFQIKYNLSHTKILSVKNHLKSNTIFVPNFADSDWYLHTKKRHKGIEKYILEISSLYNLPLNNNSVFWSNNFICHSSVYKCFLIYFRSAFNYLSNKYGYNFDYNVEFNCKNRKAAFLYERLTMLYFSNKKYNIVNMLSKKLF